MTAGAVREEQVLAMACAIGQSLATYPTVITPLGPATFRLPEEVLAHVAMDLLLAASPEVRGAYRTVLRPDLKIRRRVFTDEHTWWYAWVLTCGLCGYVQPCPWWRSAMGEAHVHLLECRAGGLVEEVPR